MNPQVQAYVSIALGATAIFFSILTRIDTKYAFRERIAVIELKINTIWSLQMREGVGEAVTGGIAKRNSPLRIEQSAMEWIVSELSTDLKCFYQENGQNLTDAEFAFLLEEQFGNRLLKDICIPHKISEKVALLIAVAVAKENQCIMNDGSLELPLSKDNV